MNASFTALSLWAILTATQSDQLKPIAENSTARSCVVVNGLQGKSKNARTSFEREYKIIEEVAEFARKRAYRGRLTHEPAGNETTLLALLAYCRNERKNYVLPSDPIEFRIHWMEIFVMIGKRIVMGIVKNDAKCLRTLLESDDWLLRGCAYSPILDYWPNWDKQLPSCFDAYRQGQPAEPMPQLKQLADDAYASWKAYQKKLPMT